MIEIQKGLYLEIKSHFAKGKTHYLSFLTSANNYCFYNKNEEIYDENGNIINYPTPNQRLYMKKDVSSVIKIEKLNEIYVSVPIEDGFQIE